MAMEERFQKALAQSKYRAFLTHYSIAELERFDVYLFCDDNMGFAITPDRELVGLFNNRHDGLGGMLLCTAIGYGAQHLYCFDGFLPQFYATAGLVEYRRAPWDDSLAPVDWDYITYGRPDVVYMRLE